ncbi:ATP-binding cassette domain-containing protein [Magnetococcales bacterium HHB-1]
MTVTVENLHHSYPARRKQPKRRALENINLTIDTGAFFVLTGPNGGGKSTLFRILSGQLQPSQGKVRIKGSDPFTHPAETRKHIGVVFQKPALDPHLTVLENLRIHANLYGLSRDDFNQRLESSLSWTGLKDRLKDSVSTLSGGLARQAELVKALLHQPPLLLMDEPTTGLDPASRRAFIEAVHRLQQEQKITVLMISHIFSEAEEADKVAILNHGQLLALDTPETLRAQLGSEMLVLQASPSQPILDYLKQKQELLVLRHQQEIRIKHADSAALLGELFSRFRENIQTLSIKRPTLEDVYIHITGEYTQEEKKEIPA